MVNEQPLLVVGSWFLLLTAFIFLDTEGHRETKETEEQPIRVNM
jgi:hypothetical protein